MPFTDSINIVKVIMNDIDALTATPNDVANGKVFIGENKKIETGSIPVNPTRSDVNLINGDTFNIPKGINPKSYNINVPPIKDCTVSTAIPEHILEPDTAWVNGEKITGFMPNIGSVKKTLKAGESASIELGYHNGSGIIDALGLAEQTQADAQSENILEGRTVWVNGKKITGSMPNNISKSKTLSAGEVYTIPKGYHDGTENISANILSSQTYGNAHGGVIVKGYNAWVNGERVDGTMPNNPQEEITLPVNGEYVIPFGYHSGFGKVVQNIPSKSKITVSPTKDPQTIQVGGYFMSEDIIVNGVNALNYQRLNSTSVDSTGVEIAEYALKVTNNSASVIINVDNWHDHNTMNVYQIISTNITDISGNIVDLDTIVMIDFISANPRIYKIGNGISITTSIKSDDHSHIIKFDGISSGSITIKEPFATRELGVENK